MPEAHRLAETIETWWPAVLAAITTGHTNARSEGYRLAKQVGRDAFGFHNRVTTDAGYGGPTLVNTGESQLRRPPCPVNFDEPLQWHFRFPRV